MTARVSAALAIATAFAGCGPTTPHQPPPPPPAIDAAPAWPTLDPAATLDGAAIATACNLVSGAELVPATAAAPVTDAFGEDRTLYTTGAVPITPYEFDPVIRVEIHARLTEGQAAAAHAAAMTAGPGTAGDGDTYATRTVRPDDDEYTTRAIHGRHGRFLYTVSEEDHVDDTVACDPTELAALAAVIARRLP